ncbi:MAG TPA: hypothetical protein VFE96_06625 [Candidatus Bathyarchaeia archaeon]|jgi:hypothetical protein|nr:hypothetical protein [Candidatus Bathyarchaeia archaeon]
MRLQITDEDPKLARYSKGLGFTSISWHRGDKMESVLHPRCFDIAKNVWQAAFNTRLVSPRRISSEV